MINLTQGRRLQARDLQHTLKSFNTLKTGSVAERQRQRQGGASAGRLREGTGWLDRQPGYSYFLFIARKGYFPLETKHQACIPTSSIPGPVAPCRELLPTAALPEKVWGLGGSGCIGQSLGCSLLSWGRRQGPLGGTSASLAQPYR